jgi:beta-glucosidase
LQKLLFRLQSFLELHLTQLEKRSGLKIICLYFCAMRVFTLTLALATLAEGFTSSTAPWLDPTAPIDTRVVALLSEMTNTEKMAQTIHLSGVSPAAAIASYNTTGLGAFPSPGSGPGGIDVRNALQAAIMNTSRLHIPVSFHSETLHGACGGCTIFPMPAGQGSTWDAQLVHDIAAAVAEEAYAVGIDRGFSPELNVPGDARFGRTEENFSEDPMLVGAFGAAAARGLHGDNVGGPSSYLAPFAIVSEAKHAVAYAFGGKDGMAADVSDRTLHDIYLRPWAEYAAAGGRGAMMSHNSVNQVPAHASAEIMGWLRAQGNFSGALLASDFCDVGLLRTFGVSTDLVGSCALAMGAGLDQELCNAVDGRGQAYTSAPAAVASGALAQAALDRAAGNALRPKFAAGLFDGRAFIDYSNLPLVDSHRALARRAAAEGSVLLKNNGVLPLAYSPSKPITVAIIGPTAGCSDNATDCDAARSMCGGYTNVGANVSTVLAAAYAEPGVRVVYAEGCSIGGNDTSGFAAAVEAARASDVVVFVGGDSGGWGWNANTCGEDDDRADLDLPGVQADLVAALGATGTPVVLVLVHGRPVTSTRADAFGASAAIIAAWRPAAEGGNALWDLLSGRQSPSGRLAQAWVRRVGQVKSQASPWFSLKQGDFDQVDYNGDVMALGVNDARSSWSPAWPFGFGLSYSTATLMLVSATATAEGVQTVVTVRNAGAATSRFVVGVYYARASVS